MKKGFGSLVILILIAVAILGSFLLYSKFRKTDSKDITSLQKISASVVPEPKKGTIKITDLTPPDFSRQKLNNLKIDKNTVDTKSVPALSKKISLISVAYAEDEILKPVYRVKRNSLSSDQAIVMANQWGFTDEPKKKDIRSDYEYFLEWGTYSSEEGTTVMKNYFQSGLYDKFDISLVWDKEAKYGKDLGLGPYNRSSLVWHTSVAGLQGGVVSKEEAGKIALEFLRSKDIFPTGDLKLNVFNKDDLGFSGNASAGVDTIVFVERGVNGLPIIDGGVSFRPESTRLMMGLFGKEVVSLSYEEFMTQIDPESFDLFPIKDEKQAFDDLLNSKSLAGKVKVNASDPKNSADIEIDWSRNSIKEIVMKDVSLAYYRNENQTWEPAGNYYQPVYVFHATALASGEFFYFGEEKVEMTFYVPAVIYVSEKPKEASSPGSN